MDKNRTIKDERNNRIKRNIVNRNNNQVISSTSISSSQYDDSNMGHHSNSARFVDTVNTKVFNTETLSQVTTSNYINDEKQICSLEPKTVTELAESLNITNIKEILEDEDSLFPDTDTSISRYNPKNRSKLTNPTNYITIINNHYYVDSENSIVDSEEDYLNYNDDYINCGDSIQPDFDVGEPMILVYSFRNKGGQSTNENTSFNRSSSTDSSESPVRRSKQRCKIIELSSPIINSERLPTPIPDQHHMDNLNLVNEGVLPVVTEVPEDTSTDNNMGIKGVLENTWISRNENINETQETLESFECKFKEESKLMKWDILPQRIRKRWARQTNPTNQKDIHDAKLSKEYDLPKSALQTNAKGIPHLNNKNVNRNFISRDHKFRTSRENTPRRAKEDISLKNKLTLQSRPAKPSGDYDSKLRPNTATCNTPVKRNVDVDNLKISFRDKLVTRAKARKEMLEAALDAQEKWSQTTFDVPEKNENFKQQQECYYGKRVTGNKNDHNWDKIGKLSNAGTPITPRKLRQNSAPSKVYQKEFMSPKKHIKKNQEIESKRQNSSETKDTVKVSKHQESSNMNMRTNSTQTAISHNKSEKLSLIVQEKSTQTTVKTNVLKQDLDEIHIHDKKQNDRLNKKLIKGKYKDELFDDNQNDKSLICLYYRPETYAEGFKASNIALCGSSREVNREIEYIIPDEIGCHKLLYRNNNFLKSSKSSEFSSLELVTARGTQSVVEMKPWWRMFSDCFKSCKLNYIFRK